MDFPQLFRLEARSGPADASASASGILVIALRPPVGACAPTFSISRNRRIDTFCRRR